ncbi:response regulator transcription factor [Pacificimonas sp. WHA3]|uniref:Response regulator transcription factor n=1 Tax=Pacificimonas pallii TaxID=2827236 RepID=A0ABS6SER1_9SPHN|nr:response regulator transcription factor [Pacificimonas pallii]MBV7256855.1 response regulator transcription factor [Pacificimonas pallii]
MSRKALRVIIADDHMIVRQGTRALLERTDVFVVVGEVDNGLNAIAETKRLMPELLLLDLAMPVITGVEVIEDVRRWSPETHIAVLTGMRNANMLRHALDGGATGLFLKSSDVDGLPDGLRAVCEGETHIDPAAASLLASAGHHTDITARERQVLFGIARGASNPDLAERLGISANTVDKHRTSLMRKLGAHSAAELVAIALRDGLLESVKHA